jgi:competence protein ComEC
VFIGFIFSFLGRRLAFLPSVVAVILFAMMTGGGPTVVRASIMAIIALFARQSGRTYEATRALIIAGLIMLIWNPKVLVFDLGFQLSFLATLGLIYLAPIIGSKIESLRQNNAIYRIILRWKWLCEIVILTIAAQLAVYPWIVYKMGELSLVALPANILVLPTISIAMFFGFLTGVIGFVSTILSLPFAWVTLALLTYILKLVELLASLPFATVTISGFPLILVIVIYLFYIWAIRRFVSQDSNARIGKYEGEEFTTS